MIAADLLTRELRGDDVIHVQTLTGKTVGAFCLDRADHFARAWDAVANLHATGSVALDWPEYLGWDKWTARYGTYQNLDEYGNVLTAGFWHRAPNGTAS